MKYEEFAKHVQSFAQLDSIDEAQKGISATLSTLAERIDAELANKLAAQLPIEISSYLQKEQKEKGTLFSLQEFYQRVIDKEKIDSAQAVEQVRAVFAVISSAVNPNDLNMVKISLSQDYEELFAV
ncbi:MAG: DUF2267 domain-containing protein, partial [Prochloraceae cyanobacterium]